MPTEKVVSFPSTPSPSKPRHKKRADGRYKDVYRYTDPLTGRRVEKSFYGKTFSEASAKKKDFIRALESGLDPQSERITVAQYVEKWLQLRALKDQDRKTGRTFYKYKRESSRLVEVLGRRQLRSITKSDLDSILLARQGLSQGAINDTYTTFRQIFRSALGDRIIQFDPMVGVEKPEGPSGSHRALEDWEKRLILDHWQGHRCGFFAMAMLFTGMRRGEACALRWEDVDFESSSIHIHEAISFDNGKSIRGKTKTESGERTVPILPPLLPILQAFRKPSGPVFTSAAGKELTENACRSMWESFRYYLSMQMCGGVHKRYVELHNQKAMAENPDLYSPENPKHVWRDITIQMHDLRHTYCTMLFDAGIDIKSTQYLMGHKSISVTIRIYTHLSNTRKQFSLQRLIQFSSLWVNEDYSSAMDPAAFAPESPSPLPGAFQVTPSVLSTVGQSVGQNNKIP